MILDKLVMIFDADMKGIEKGTQAAEKGADDVTAAMKRAEAQSKKTGDSLMTFAKGALGWLAAAASASKLMGMAVARAGEVDALDKLSEQLGTTITETDSLARSIVALGGSTDQAQGDLSKLADAFEKQGIKPMQGMMQLSDKLSRMDYAQAAKKLKEFGIVEKSTVELMRNGRFEIQRMMDEQARQGAITADAAKKAREFNATMDGFKNKLSDVSNTLIGGMMPAMTGALEILTKIVDWVAKNKDFVVGFFIAIATAVAIYFGPAMWAAAVATIAATWPFLAIGAAIAVAALAFAAIYDDIMTFIDGGESMIGLVLEKFPIIGEIARWLADVFKIAFEGILEVGQAMWAGIQNIADGVVGVLKWMGAQVKSAVEFVMGLVGKVKGAVDWLGSKLGFGGGEVKASVTQAQTQITQAAATPMAQTTGGAIRNASTGSSVEQNLSIGQVTVQTQATDAKGMAAGTRSELSDQLQKMQANNATALAR